MLSDAEHDLLNSAFEKYRPGQLSLLAQGGKGDAAEVEGLLGFHIDVDACGHVRSLDCVLVLSQAQYRL
jgi:hypothetical protein